MITKNLLQYFLERLKYESYYSTQLKPAELYHAHMAVQQMDSLWVALVGTGKGSGSILAIGIFGACSCLPFRADKHIWRLEESRLLSQLKFGYRLHMCEVDSVYNFIRCAPTNEKPTT